MLSDADLVAFVATRNLATARAFYEVVLGLRVVEESDFAVVYDANGTQLRVTLVAHLDAAPYTVLGWKVDDIDERVAALRSAGVPTRRYDSVQQDEDGVWTAPDGTRVAWFSDPDGNTLSLQQPPSP